jgi:predicted transcriptional regulator
LQEAAELLFELGSEDRLKVLMEVSKEPMKLSLVAQNLSSTIQEAARQCGRLEEAGLLEKHPDGKYGLTTLGKVSLTLLPAFVLLHEEREYFASHDASSLPSEFVERIGELLDHKRVDHIDDALKFQQRVVKESERFAWFMSDQPVGHSMHPEHTHFSLQTHLRIILPKTVDTDVFRSARNTMGSRLQIGLLDDVKIVVAMNEKIAAMGLPTFDRRIDYSRGLSGDTPTFHGWCADLFSYYWEKAVKKYPEENDSD